MTSDKPLSAVAEWRAFWILPFAAMVGYSTMGLQSYAIGPFVAPLENEFGWSRADVMLGISISNAVGIFLNAAIGMIVDRIGPRRVALTGLFVKSGAFALLGTATGALLNWSMLWLLVAFGLLLVQSTVWSSAVASRFDKSRGLAMAVALSGTPLAALIAPVLATYLIEAYGWRTGFAGVGGVWLILTLPVVFLFFHDTRSTSRRKKEEAPQPPAELPGLTFREGIRTRAFSRLFISFGCFSFYSMTISVNLVPLISETGMDAMKAAGIASIMGLVGIIARLTVGMLLDRFPGHIIGTVTQLLPVIGCILLLTGESSTLLVVLAVITFGAALGAEIDVALYLASRHFGLRSFAALFGGIIGFGAVNAAIGPYVAGLLHDISGSYDPLLIVTSVMLVLGALAIATIGRPPELLHGAGH
ncbi:MAG: MFS transporter [Novosphingobium sp.]|nr:MFS transporter [Novosphingobium sp.]MCP5401000.1 MFS transporter [Novosphingobium sp.]